MSVTHIWSTLPLKQKSGEVEVVRLGRGEDARVLLRRTTAWPRVYITRYVVTANADKQFAAILLASIHAKENGQLPLVVSPGSYTSLADKGVLARDRVIGVTYSTNVVDMDVQTMTPGMLVLSDTNFPAWRCYVNGIPTPIVTANGMLRSTLVPAGRSRVSMIYDSTAQRFGNFLSLCGVMSLAFFTSAHVANTRRRRLRTSATKHLSAKPLES
jgi:hypothetical protein